MLPCCVKHQVFPALGGGGGGRCEGADVHSVGGRPESSHWQIAARGRIPNGTFVSLETQLLYTSTIM